MHEISYSFLLPIYQVENYIGECLESILNQTYPNFEVILLIDGSKDRSIEIAQEYANKDDRFKVYEQENIGIFKSRIKLVELSKNDICVFVDPDDSIEHNLLESLNLLFIKQRCDLVLYRFNRVTNSGKIYMKDWKLFSDNSLFTKENKYYVWDKFISSNRLNHVWSKAFKRELFDQNEFIEYTDLYGEDVIISMHLIHNAKRIGYRDLTLYNYRNSDNGLGRNFKLKYLDDSETVRKEVYHFLKKIGGLNTSIIHKFYKSYIKSILRNLKLLSGNYPYDGEMLTKFKSIHSSQLYIQANRHLKDTDLKHMDKIYFYLFKNKYYKTFVYVSKIEFFFRKRLKRLLRN